MQNRLEKAYLFVGIGIFAFCRKSHRLSWRLRKCLKRRHKFHS